MQKITSFNETMRIVFITLMMTFFTVGLKDSSFAMSSGNYQITPDVLNEAGGYSSSATYRIWHNLSENSSGVSESANYRINTGFFADESPMLIFSISSNSLDLGVLSAGSIATQNTTLATSTNAINGYTIEAYDNTDAGVPNGLIDEAKKIADATAPNSYINFPSAGTEHYGLTVTGTHAASGYAGGTKINSLDNSTWVDIATYGSFIASDNVVVQYRASISNTSPAGQNYQAITTLVCTANY